MDRRGFLRSTLATATLIAASRFLPLPKIPAVVSRKVRVVLVNRVFTEPITVPAGSLISHCSFDMPYDCWPPVRVVADPTAMEPPELTMITHCAFRSATAPPDAGKPYDVPVVSGVCEYSHSVMPPRAVFTFCETRPC